MGSNKPRIVKDFEKLDPEIQEQIKLSYSDGFHMHLVSYSDKDGQRRSALPFETEDKYYLVRMSVIEAKQIVEDDEDYDEEGNLRPEIQEDYEEKYQDMGEDDDIATDHDSHDAPIDRDEEE